MEFGQSDWHGSVTQPVDRLLSHELSCEAGNNRQMVKDGRAMTCRIGIETLTGGLGHVGLHGCGTLDLATRLLEMADHVVEYRSHWRT